MKAAVLRAPGELAIAEVEDPGSPGPGFVRVRVEAVGLCGSDVHYYREGRIGDFVLRAPMILGHEIGGRVEAVGEGVDLAPGSVVALEPGIPCGTCRWCLSGRYNLCPDVRFFATPPVDGALAEHVNHPAAFTFAADPLSPMEAALAEPLSVGVYAAELAGIRLGARVGVVGSGPVGILCGLAAEASGGEVSLFDLDPSRIDAARSMGLAADHIDAGSDSVFDAVIECSGSGSGCRFAVAHTTRGGAVVLVGLGRSEDMRIPGLELATKGIRVEGVFRYRNAFRPAIALLKRVRPRLGPLLARTIPMEDLPRYLADGRERETLKTMVAVHSGAGEV